jgi:uncharacterized protein YdeI (BOF family)
MKHLLVSLFLPILIFAQDHLLITEVFVPPSGDASPAFVEIFNPTDTVVWLNQIYLANYNTYYNMVNETYSANAAHFVVQFPNIELNADETIAIATNGTGFFEYFGKRADYEVFGSDDITPDMIDLKVGNNPSFNLTSGMIVLFTWDGAADLIEDVDYVPWGIFNTSWMDKSNVEIDGPDADNNASAYNTDQAKSSQQAQSAPTDGKSLQRSGLVEVDEVSTSGNGINGHNEATENWESSFIKADPGPGSFSENPGDGTGTATISPDSVLADSETNVVIQVTSTSDYTIATLEITIPDGWMWGGNITRSGSGLALSSELISGNVITINNAVISDTEIGIVTINDITSPEATGNYVFEIKTAIAGGQLTEIGAFPRIYVKEPIIIETITIEEARQLPVGSDVSVKGIVIIGVGKLHTTFTDVYIQDESGYGINIYKSGTLDQNLQRGNEVYIQGELTEYNGLLEITNYKLTLAAEGFELPDPILITTDQASSTEYDSRFVVIRGGITGTSTDNYGRNIYMDDGTGECTVRVWNTANIDLTNYEIGEYVFIKGMGSVYNNAGQILLTYQDDIYKPTFDSSGVHLKLVNRPFVPDKGELMNIEYSSGAKNSHINLRIFDLGGRLIVTLIDGVGVPFTNIYQWNGRNYLGELVPVGTYICHLEVINEDTGKRTEKLAPIVVGTVLK